MELAKFAYRFTYDQENFDILAPSFSFETSMKEADKYINEQRVAIKELDE